MVFLLVWVVLVVVLVVLAVVLGLVEVVASRYCYRYKKNTAKAVFGGDL